MKKREEKRKTSRFLLGIFLGILLVYLLVTITRYGFMFGHWLKAARA